MKEKKCPHNMNMKLHGTVTLWPKGQVVIPKEIRDMLGIWPGSSLSFLTKNDKFIWIVRNEDIWELMEYIRLDKLESES